MSNNEIHPVAYVRNQRMKEAFESNPNWQEWKFVSMNIPNPTLWQRFFRWLNRLFRG